MAVLEMIVSSTVGAVGGAALVVWGLSGFLGKVWAERILEAERAKFGRDLEALKSALESDIRRLQAEIDRTIVVHRVHFETEFSALRDIWQKVSRVRSLLPLLGPLDGSKPQATEAYELMSTAVAELVTAIDSQSPFYSSSIYEKLDDLRLLAKVELTEVATEKPNEVPDWWKRRRETRNEIHAKVDAISKAIRARLEQLSVVTKPA